MIKGRDDSKEGIKPLECAEESSPCIEGNQLAILPAYCLTHSFPAEMRSCTTSSIKTCENISYVCVNRLK